MKIASMSDKEVRGGRRKGMKREELVPNWLLTGRRMKVNILEVWEHSCRQRRPAAAAVLGLWRCLQREAALLQKEAAEAQKVPIHHKSNLLLLAQMCVGTPPRCQATHGQMR